MDFQYDSEFSDDCIKSIFNRFDVDKSGAISFIELQKALSFGSWGSFNEDTVKLLIDLFDTNHSGSITFKEFNAIWNFVSKWVQSLKLFDQDDKGYIEAEQLKSVFEYYGFSLCDSVINTILEKYDETEKLHFDNFIQCYIMLMNLTRGFQAYDENMDGNVKIHINQFLAIVFQDLRYYNLININSTKV